MCVCVWVSVSTTKSFATTRALDEKERKLYAPMSDVGAVTFDKDAIYIKIKDKHVRFTKPSERQLDTNVEEEEEEEKQTKENGRSKEKTKNSAEAETKTDHKWVSSWNVEYLSSCVEKGS